MTVGIIPVKTPGDWKAFIEFPYRLYRGNPAWVPPLRTEMRRITNRQTNSYLQTGPFAAWLAVVDGMICGRILAGVDQKTNATKGLLEGHFALFEVINRFEVAKALLDTACNFLREQGLNSVRGPVSPTNGDDFRGMLLNDFERPPVLMNTYNPPYYPEFLDRYGFVKNVDLYAFHFEAKVPRRPEVVEYAMQRYGYTIAPINLNRLEQELLDIKWILDVAMPEEWRDLIPPDLKELRAMAKELRPLVVPDLIFIARYQGQPIGFNLTLPDYHQAQIKLRNGRLFPTGWLKFLYWKRRINGLRFFVMFVVPEFRKKGVSAAIFYKSFQAAERLGYSWCEGSTIGEDNFRMRHDVERAGGRHYRTYRIYRKDLV